MGFVFRYRDPGRTVTDTPDTCDFLYRHTVTETHPLECPDYWIQGSIAQGVTQHSRKERYEETMRTDPTKFSEEWRDRRDRGREGAQLRSTRELPGANYRHEKVGARKSPKTKKRIYL